MIGHVGYALVMLGTYLIGEQLAVGWGVSILGGLVWLGLGIKMEMTSIWVWESIFLVNALWAWSKWI